MPTNSVRQMDEQYAERCRRSLADEQARSLAATGGWAHVDKDRVHADWNARYREIAVCVEGARPEDDRAQVVIEKHFEIASRLYSPTREACIGMALLYSEDAAMKAFHNACHPGMVEFLGPDARVRGQTAPRHGTPNSAHTALLAPWWSAWACVSAWADAARPRS